MDRRFTDLNVGFSNAGNYQKKENKPLLEKYFVRDEHLERILNPNVYYLIGEKGTGKTAYATYIRNTEYKGHQCSIYDVTQTEYQKFLELKRQGHLPLSQYVEVWRTLLLMIAATSILRNSGTPDFLKQFTKLKSLKAAIDEFYQNAFAPEIVKMISFVESAEVSSKLIAKHMGTGAEVAGKTRDEIRDANSIFQVHLLKLRQQFESALSTLKLDQDQLIFIDGIDVRPADIAYSDYFECVRGLVEGIWTANNDFFGNIKDSKGRIRIVLLVRPDTFLQTGLHNLNTKLRDNSVFLDWLTTYKDYRGSLLFRVADRLLAVQQSTPPKNIGEAWDYYFPFYAENVTYKAVSGKAGVNSFLAFLRFSYYRPRDITAMIATMQEIIKRDRDIADYVTGEDFNNPSFRDAHANYLLGEIRDQLLFYYSRDEFDLFLQFFSHLRGKRKFSYDFFVEVFNDFISECASQGKVLPKFFESANVFLQFLYDQNVICYKERDPENDNAEPFIRWCFRERTLSNMAPKVRIGVDYEIFYGLSKAVNVGREIRIKKLSQRHLIGTIMSINEEKRFGHIRGGEQQNDYYFKLSDFDRSTGSPRVNQKVSFEAYTKYGKPRARAVRLKR